MVNIKRSEEKTKDKRRKIKVRERGGDKARGRLLCNTLSLKPKLYLLRGIKTNGEAVM